MNLLQRALIEKMGYDNGFEHVLAQETESVSLALSSSSNASRGAGAGDRRLRDLFEAASSALIPELQRSFGLPGQSKCPLGGYRSKAARAIAPCS